MGYIEVSAEERVFTDGRTGILVTCSGEVDSYTCQELKDELATAFETLKARIPEVVSASELVIEVNLDRVRYIDSSGLGALIGALKECRAVQIQFRIDTGTSIEVKRVMRITGLYKVFEIVPAAA